MSPDNFSFPIAPMFKEYQPAAVPEYTGTDIPSEAAGASPPSTSNFPAGVLVAAPTAAAPLPPDANPDAGDSIELNDAFLTPTPKKKKKPMKAS